MPYNFAVIGCGGYIAPRHLKAIKDTGNNLVAAVDPKDSVGILDQFGYNVQYFTEIERFDRHIERLRKTEQKIDFFSICSPNYLHDAHIRLALRAGANAICEKPLTINPWNLDALEELEQETDHKVYTVLQLRLSPVIIKLKQDVDAVLKLDPGHLFRVDLKYFTPRGDWYGVSWKGDNAKSGGLPINIGIHLFDVLLWLFGKPDEEQPWGYVNGNCQTHCKGYYETKVASIDWTLSIDPKDQHFTDQGLIEPVRYISIDDKTTNFSGGFTNLHTAVYQDILAGRGFGISDARPSVELAYSIRSQLGAC